MRALLIVDLQNDFLPNGALAVPNGDEIISVVNQLQKSFEFVVATKDWHPSNHFSFSDMHENKKRGDIVGVQQILWPRHCEQNSFGAEFPGNLDSSKIKKVFYKGVDPYVDSYSAFYDNDKKVSTGLDNYLRNNNIDELFFVGLATDYCVKYSVLDALSLNYQCFVVIDGCRGIDLNKGDVDNAISEMKNHGANIILSEKILEAYVVE